MQHVKWKERSDHTKHKRCFKVLECNCRRRILMMREAHNSYYYVYMRPTENGALETVLPQLSMNSSSLWKKMDWGSISQIFEFFFFFFFSFSTITIVHFTFHSKKYISLFSSQIPSKTRTLTSSSWDDLMNNHEIKKWRK